MGLRRDTGFSRLTRLATRVALPRRRTARRRLTVMYVVMFLVSGVILLVITGTLAVRSSHSAVSPSAQAPQNALSQANAQIAQLRSQLSTESATAHAQADHQLLIGSLIALGVMSVISVVLGLVVAGRVLRPLREMADTTRRISADNLNERLAMPGPRDELKDLADTIDGLLERLEGAFAAQRRFVANASHELRTPLTTIRASLDVAVAKPGPVPPQTVALTERLRIELDQVDRLLDGFLVLARAQHGALPARQQVALGDLTARALTARAGEITAKHLVVQHTTSATGSADSSQAWVDGSHPLLTRMVDNVIDNAIAHNAEGGWIHAITGAEGHRATLTVETGGPVLDQAEVDQLIQPFRRLAAERTGSDQGAGLGLSIVAAIVTAHNGALSLHARSEGGLRVSIDLPLAAPAEHTAPAGVRA
jgi:signal transduction histidine kinase